LRHLIIQIPPIGIRVFDKIDLPLARPVFDVLFSLNGIQRRIVYFIIAQLVEIIALGKALYGLRFVFVNSPDQIVRDPDIKRPVGAVGQHVDEI
jgi:hypothetical protein